MEIIIACKCAPLAESINFAETNNVGIEVKSFTSSHVFHSDWHGLLDMIKKQLQHFSGSKSLHGTFDTGPFTWNRLTFKEIKDSHLKCLTVATELGTKTLIVHSTYIPGLTNWKYKDWLNFQIELWGCIASEAQKNGITVAIENIVDERPSSLIDVIEAVNLPNLKVCIDFGHLNLITTSRTPLEWIEDLKDHLYYTHIHNNNGRYDSHSSIDNGTINYNLVFKKLLALENIPIMAIEVDTLEGIKTSLNELNAMTKKLLPNANASD